MGQGIELTDQQWTMALAQVRHVSRNARLKCTHFNYVHQTYLSPHRLHHMFTEATPRCPRCGHDDATFLHMTWECPEIHSTWRHIMQHVSDIIDVSLTLDPLLCLLGVTKQNKRSKYYMKFVDLALTLFKCMIAMAWKATRPPDVQAWLRVVLRWTTAEVNALDQDRQAQDGDGG
ncbi:hypothetical protein NDU88_001760 [Pleurodeles waltl]|uniref:Reverse transcriptase n=1 Tax=Pleurodeles waltl TaxID=8319 RepID=A0AAV7MLB3_PLEWA|nr:hypothetical protein NDU88_001760 [Pleurodeles waltl]